MAVWPRRFDFKAPVGDAVGEAFDKKSVGMPIPIVAQASAIEDTPYAFQSSGICSRRVDRFSWATIKTSFFPAMISFSRRSRDAAILVAI